VSRHVLGEPPVQISGKGRGKDLTFNKCISSPHLSPLWKVGNHLRPWSASKDERAVTGASMTVTELPLEVTEANVLLNLTQTHLCVCVCVGVCVSGCGCG